MQLGYFSLWMKNFAREFEFVCTRIWSVHIYRKRSKHIFIQ